MYLYKYYTNYKFERIIVTNIYQCKNLIRIATACPYTTFGSTASSQAIMQLTIKLPLYWHDYNTCKVAHALVCIISLHYMADFNQPFSEPRFHISNL